MNNRNDKDMTLLNDILYSGTQLNKSYPKKLSADYQEDNEYVRKEEKFNFLFIGGG